MGFTPFIDDLALIEVLIALVGALLAYAGVLVWWAMRNNDAKGVRTALRGLSVPLGITGLVVLILALWSEMTWPILLSDGIGGYNIFFFDPLLLFGVVLVAYSISAHYSFKLHYVGLVAFIFGAVTMFYGWTGYTSAVPFTKDPLDTFLMYLAFGATGLFAFPASVVIDYFLACSDANERPFVFGQAARTPATRGLGVRGVASISPKAATESSAEPAASEPAYHFPYWAQVLVLLFPFFAALAAIAAFWYFGITLPGHLGAGAGGAP